MCLHYVIRSRKVWQGFWVWVQIEKQLYSEGEDSSFPFTGCVSCFKKNQEAVLHLTEDISICRVCCEELCGLLTQEWDMYDPWLPCLSHSLTNRLWGKVFNTLEAICFNAEIIIVIRTKMKYMTVLPNAFSNLCSSKTFISTTGRMNSANYSELYHLQ